MKTWTNLIKALSLVVTLSFLLPSFVLAGPDPSTPNSLSSSGCFEVTQPGTIVLDKDITAGAADSLNSPCINFHDVSNANLDCQNHTITVDASQRYQSAIEFKGVNNFSIKNCQIKTVNAPTGFSATPLTINILNSNNGELSNNKIRTSYNEMPLVFVKDGTAVKVINNDFYASYQQTRLTNSLVSNNIFNTPSVKNPGVAVVFNTNGGSNNEISNNTFSGGSDGVFHSDLSTNIGSDDVIVVGDETGLKILNNHLSNVWDCGIENLGYLKNSIIKGNQISNAPICAIGGWYYSSWEGNTVEDNSASNTGPLFYLYRLYGFREGENTVSFKDNVFKNNSITNPKNPSELRAMVNFEPISIKGDVKDVKPENFSTGNNSFTGNNFGTDGEISLLPKTMIVDGGANICKNSFSGIKCGSSGTQSQQSNQGETSQASSTAREGKLVNQNGAIFKIEYGKKRVFISPAALLSNNYSFKDVLSANNAEVALSEGEIIGIKDGALLRDGKTIYVIENGKKRAFTSMSVFKSFGYNSRNVVNTSLKGVPEGPALSTAATRHPRGALVNDKGAIYFMGVDYRYPHSSAEDFLSWGNRWQDVVPANTFDLTVPVGPIQ